MNNAQMQGLRNIAQGVLGGTIGGPDVVPERTLSARLEEANRTIDNQCRRIEHALARVNGAPVQTQSEKGATPQPTTPLSSSVGHTEALAQALCELAAGIERIA